MLVVMTVALDIHNVGRPPMIEWQDSHRACMLPAHHSNWEDNISGVYLTCTVQSKWLGMYAKCCFLPTIQQCA